MPRRSKKNYLIVFCSNNWDSETEGYLLQVEKIIDLKSYENEGFFLEGTGSVVFDHLYKKAYACSSSRTNMKLVQKICLSLNYEPVTFEGISKYFIYKIYNKT